MVGNNNIFNTAASHTWKVAVVCTGGEYPISVTKASCTPPPPPCNPATNLKVEIGEGCINAYLTWTAAPNMPNAQYNIYRDGEKIATVTETKYTDIGDFGGMVEFRWTVKTVCEDGEATGTEVADECEVYSINELANSVAIYPNPVSGMITIAATGFAKVEVYNPIGQLIETKTVKTFDLSSYNTGLYFFKIYDVYNNSITKRVMVAR